MSDQNVNAVPLGSLEPFSAEYSRSRIPAWHTRVAAPFYCAEFDYWIVTRYDVIRRIFQSPASFTAANTLAPFIE